MAVARLQIPAWRAGAYLVAADRPRAEAYIAETVAKMKTSVAGSGANITIGTIQKYIGATADRAAYVLPIATGSPIRKDLFLVIFTLPGNNGVQTVFATNNTTTTNNNLEGSAQDAASYGTYRPLIVMYYPNGADRLMVMSGTTDGPAATIGHTVTSGSKAGVIVDVDGSNWTVRQTAGERWVAGDNLVTSGGAELNNISITSATYPRMTFTNWETLEHSSGDFMTMPTPTIYSDLAAFEAGVAVPFKHALLYHQSVDLSSTFEIIVDDGSEADKPFLCILNNRYDTTGDILEFLAVGRIIKPYKTTDDYDYAKISITFQQNPFTYLPSETNYGRAVYGHYSGGGAAAVFTIHGSNPMGLKNASDDAGSLPYAELSVYNANEFKGFVDPRVIRMTCGNNYHRLRTTSLDGNIAIKMSRHYAYAWVGGESGSPIPFVVDYSTIDRENL